MEAPAGHEKPAIQPNSKHGEVDIGAMLACENSSAEEFIAWRSVMTVRPFGGLELGNFGGSFPSSFSVPDSGAIKERENTFMPSQSALRDTSHSNGSAGRSPALG